MCNRVTASFRKHRLQEMGFSDSDVGAGGKSSSFAEQGGDSIDILDGLK